MTPLAEMYLRMLRRLVNHRADSAEEMNELGLRMVNLCIDACYRECKDAGASDEAWKVLTRAAPR